MFFLTILHIVASFFKTILFGLFLSAGLWVLCIYICKQVCYSYRLEIKHHLFGFVVASLVFVLCCFLSGASFALDTLSNVKQTFIAGTELAGFVEKQTKSLVSDNNAGTFIVEEVNQNIQEEYPSLKKYLKEENLSSSLQTELSTVLHSKQTIQQKSRQIVELVIDEYLGGVERSIRKTWWILFLSIVLVEALYFGVMINSAKKQSGRRTCMGGSPLDFDWN